MSPNGVFCPGDSQLATDSHDNTKKNISPTIFLFSVIYSQLDEFNSFN